MPPTPGHDDLNQPGASSEAPVEGRPKACGKHVALSEVGGNPAYRRWIATETREP